MKPTISKDQKKSNSDSKFTFIHLLVVLGLISTVVISSVIYFIVI